MRIAQSMLELWMVDSYLRYLVQTLSARSRYGNLRGRGFNRKLELTSSISKRDVVDKGNGQS